MIDKNTMFLVKALLYTLNPSEGVIVSDNEDKLFIVYTDRDEDGLSYINLLAVSDAGGLEDQDLEEGSRVWMHENKETMEKAKAESRKMLH